MVVVKRRLACQVRRRGSSRSRTRRGRGRSRPRTTGRPRNCSRAELISCRRCSLPIEAWHAWKEAILLRQAWVDGPVNTCPLGAMVWLEMIQAPGSFAAAITVIGSHSVSFLEAAPRVARCGPPDRMAARWFVFMASPRRRGGWAGGCLPAGGARCQLSPDPRGSVRPIATSAIQRGTGPDGGGAHGGRIAALTCAGQSGARGRAVRSGTGALAALSSPSERGWPGMSWPAGLGPAPWPGPHRGLSGRPAGPRARGARAGSSACRCGRASLSSPPQPPCPGPVNEKPRPSLGD
jgi:hypothetical protein